MSVLDLLFPPRCFGCAAFLYDTERQARCCGRCACTVHRVESPVCPRCALPRELRTGDDVECGACTERPPPFDAVRAVFVYDGAVADAIRRAKVTGDPATLLDLIAHGADAFDRILGGLHGAQWTTPPAHRRDLARRGWDPARCAAREILGPRGVALHDPLVKTRRTTNKQARLGQRGRITALRGVFEPVRLVQGDWVVFDDVMTTGATLAEIARTLREAGARSVVGVVIARSV